MNFTFEIFCEYYITLKSILDFIVKENNHCISNLVIDDVYLKLKVHSKINKLIDFLLNFWSFIKFRDQNFQHLFL